MKIRYFPLPVPFAWFFVGNVEKSFDHILFGAVSIFRADKVYGLGANIVPIEIFTPNRFLSFCCYPFYFCFKPGLSHSFDIPN